MNQSNDLFGRLRSFPVFRACSNEFVASLAAMAQSRVVAQGDPILLEGDVNEHLYLLSAGQVEVLVEGERVARLDCPGDLMGEISVLTQRVVTASLFALTPVEYLAVPMQDLEDLIGDEKSEFGYQLYRALSEVLSDKLVRTNDKARGFEIANRELEEANRTLELKVKERTADLQKRSEELQGSNLQLEARNTELLASHRKLEELYSSKDMTFKKLNQLHGRYLTPLLDTLKELETEAMSQTGSGSADDGNGGGGEEERARIARARSQVESSLEMLKPMSELYSTEQAIRSRRVLLVEPDRKQQVISKLALGGTGVRLDIASTAEETLVLLKSGVHFDLVFISSELAALIPEARQSLPSAKLVFMASSNIPTELPALKGHSPLISNIVSRHPEDRTFTVKNVATTVSKLISKDLFGLEKYMIWGVEVQSRLVRNSKDRSSLIDEMQNHFQGLGIRGGISDRAATVAEELLMNAIYDAPVSGDGRPLYNHLPRTQEVQLQKGQEGELRYACDGMLAAVSVSDPFGGFQMRTLLDYLERNYMPGADMSMPASTDEAGAGAGVNVSVSSSDSHQMSGKGGAGRGLHQIIENSDMVVFNVHRNLRTEVIALFNLDARAVVEGAKPSFHFFLE